MNNLFKKIAIATVGLVMAIGVGVGIGDKTVSKASAETITLLNTDFATSWSTSQEEQTGTVSGFTFSSTKGMYDSAHLRLYADNTHTLSSSVGNITKAVFTCTANGTSNYGPGKMSGSGYTPSTGKTGTWQGNATSFTLSGGQARVVSIEITYTPTASYTLTYNKNDSGAGGTMSNTTGADPVVAECGFTVPTGKVFSHWYTTSSGTGGTRYNPGDKPKATLTLYAIWKTLSSIAVTTPPTKTTYNDGESFDSAGMVVTATFGDASTSDVTSSCTFTPDPLTEGTTFVTVSYGGQTTTQAVTVNGVPRYEKITSVDGLVANAKYIVGDTSGSVFLSTTQNGNNRGVYTPTGTITNNIIAYEVGMEVVQLGGTTGAWTLTATNPETNPSGATGYLYAAGNSSNNYLRTRNAEATWTIVFNGSGVPTLTSTVPTGTDKRDVLMYNSSNTIFSCYKSSASYTAVSLWKLIDTSESVAISQSSVSGFKGDDDETIEITASNFTPTNITVAYSTESIATVTKGTIANKKIPLTVSFDGVGSTTATITVKGGKADYTVTLDITVAAKPSVLRVVKNRAADPLEDITSEEIQNGGSARQFAKTNIYVEDTDGNAIEIGTISDYVTLTKESGDDCISISGGSITGTALGTAVVKFTLKSLTSVYDTVTVKVVNDYKTTVKTITVINDVIVDQGETLEVSDHISSAVANTRFGSTLDIADNELLFSWTNNRSDGAIYSSFVFDVTDPDLPEGDTEERTIYVFVTFDEKYAGTSFSADIKAASRPVTGLLVDGVAKSNNDNINLSLPRNTTYNFNEHVTVNPANATQSHDIIYTITSGSSYISITNGVITVGSKIGTSVAVINVKPYALQSFSITYTLTITRETIKITADMPVSFTKVTSVGDLSDGEYALVYENGTSSRAFDGGTFADAADNYVAASIENDELEATSTLRAATVWITNTEDGYTIQSHDKTKYITGKQSDKNGCTIGTSPTYNSITFGTESDVVVALIKDSSNNVLRMNPNSGNPWFRFYRSSTYTGQNAIQLYKLEGGAEEVTVNDALFNVVNNAMSLKAGSTTLYDLGLCDASGASFDTDAWEKLGEQFTSAIITDNKLQYAVANEAGNEIEQFLACYDYVIKRYGEGYDFLGRVASGKINLSGKVSPMILIGNNSNATIAVFIISIISVTAIGGYFFLRKKKED